jgi:hypothetical protein
MSKILTKKQAETLIKKSKNPIELNWCSNTFNPLTKSKGGVFEKFWFIYKETMWGKQICFDKELKEPEKYTKIPVFSNYDKFYV